jgi:DNA polymerase-3 subunit delta'
MLGREAIGTVTESLLIPDVSAPLPWQAQVWSRLTRQMEDEQLPHALLLTGPQYTGKSLLAMALARALLCAKPVGGLNCGKCHACHLSASGSHGDFRWLQPEGKSRVIKIEQIRKVMEFSNRTAGFGLRKVMVIAPAEGMNINAANALLKLLEEPAANTYIILVCHRLQGLPATIRSRCQLLRLATPPREQSLAWLDRVCGSRAGSDAFLDLGGGRPLLAAQLHGQPAADKLRLARRAMADLFGGRSGVAPLAAALAEDELDVALAHLVEGVQLLVRGLDSQRLASPQAKAAFHILDEIQQVRRAIDGGSNPNRQLLLEALLAKVQRELGDGGLGDNIGRNPRGAHQ